jgi:lipoprotein-releasing system ATP-binding protein
MIELEQVSVSFGDSQVLDRVDLRVGAGEKLAVSGASGSGKSTLLRLVIGQLRPDSGFVRLRGEELTTRSLARLRREAFYLPQEIRPLGDETVEEYLRTPLELSVNKQRRFERTRAVELLERVRLGEALLDRRLSELSGGERKRVGFARGLLLERHVVLADEPTASVDERNRRNLVDLLMDDPRLTVVAVTHDHHMMARASRHLELRDCGLHPAGAEEI